MLLIFSEVNKMAIRKFGLIMILALAAFSSSASAQQPAEPQLVLTATKDSVYIMVTGLPAAGIDGFVAYRADKGSSDFTKITPEPIKTIKDYEKAKSVIGETKVADLFNAARAMNMDEFYAAYAKSPSIFDLLSMFSLDMNTMLGRLYVDKSVTPGASYVYKVALVNAGGSEVKTLPEAETAVKPASIQPPSGFKLEAKDGAANLTWDKAGKDYNGIGWDVYRGAAKEGPFEKANKSVISIMGESAFHEMMLKNDTTYYYYIVGVDLAGNASTPSPTLEAKPKDMTPPAAPVEFAISVNKEGKALLTWKVNLEPDTAGYTIYRGPEMEAKTYDKLTSKLLPPDASEYTDSNVEEGVFYYYRITASDKNGNESPNSTTVSLRKPDTTPPSSPIAVAGKIKDKALLITWGKDKKEPDLFGYNVYRGTAPDKMTKLNESVIKPDVTEYVDYGVVSGEKYFYSVAALDVSMNESKTSDPIEVKAPDTIPPEFPANLFAQPYDRRVVVNWPPNMESDLAGYRLYRSASADGKGAFAQLGKDIPKATATFQDIDVKNGAIYWYYLTAFDEAGNESQPSDRVMARPRDDVPPTAPAGVAGEPVDDGVLVKWSANPEDDIAGYKVLRSELSTGVYTKISGDTLLPATASSFKDTTATDPAKGYFYRITAMDTSDNESERSTPAGPLTIKKQEESAPKKEDGSNK